MTSHLWQKSKKLTPKLYQSLKSQKSKISTSKVSIQSCSKVQYSSQNKHSKSKSRRQKSCPSSDESHPKIASKATQEPPLSGSYPSALKNLYQSHPRWATKVTQDLYRSCQIASLITLLQRLLCWNQRKIVPTHLSEISVNFCQVIGVTNVSYCCQIESLCFEVLLCTITLFKISNLKYCPGRQTPRIRNIKSSSKNCAKSRAPNSKRRILPTFYIKW